MHKLTIMNIKRLSVVINLEALYNIENNMSSGTSDMKKRDIALRFETHPDKIPLLITTNIERN